MDDPDADYTHRAYDLDDPTKVELRRFRREVYEDRRALLEEAKEDLDWLLAQIREMTRQQRWDEARRFLSVMRNLQRAQLGALRDLSRFRAIPQDAPATCSCSAPEELTLPPELAGCTILLESLEADRQVLEAAAPAIGFFAPFAGKLVSATGKGLGAHLRRVVAPRLGLLRPRPR